MFTYHLNVMRTRDSSQIQEIIAHVRISVGNLRVGVPQCI